jgi:GGDEF domain-containing protein
MASPTSIDPAGVPLYGPIGLFQDHRPAGRAAPTVCTGRPYPQKNGGITGDVLNPDHQSADRVAVEKTAAGVIAGVAGSVVLGVAAAGRALVWSRRRVQGLERSLAAARDDVQRVAHDDLIDVETGLLDGRYFRVALEQRVAAARRKLQPLAVMLIEVDREHPSPLSFVEQAGIVCETLREADTSCRIGATRLGLILEEATEFGGVFAIERVRMAVNQAGGDEEHLWAGVAGYPTHALDAQQLLERAELALERARESGRGWVRVARSE